MVKDCAEKCRTCERSLPRDGQEHEGPQRVGRVPNRQANEAKSQPGPSGLASDRGAGIGCVTTGLTTVNRPPIASQGKHEEGRSQPLKCGKVQNHAALTMSGNMARPGVTQTITHLRPECSKKTTVRDRNRRDGARARPPGQSG